MIVTAMGALHFSDLPTVVERLLQPLTQSLLGLGSMFSLASLACALAIAAGQIIGRRRARGRPVNLKLLRRVLFSRSVWLSPSTRADLGFFLLNVWVAGLLLAGALLSSSWIAHSVGEGLRGALGVSPLEGAPIALAVLIGTVAAYLAYEFGYWIDHYLSHKVPALWAFHKVHHTAEVMTPLTVFRVHPMESLKFHNILAVVMGATGGVTAYLFGPGPHELLVFGQNAILIVFVFSVVHLQHSHAWMTFGGGLGRLVMSPAHHQIHHSADPRHFGKNLGSFLTIWDRAFGTLHTPGERPPAGLRFGAPGEAPHTVTGGLITPFVDSWAALRPSPPAAASRPATR